MNYLTVKFGNNAAENLEAVNSDKINSADTPAVGQARPAVIKSFTKTVDDVTLSAFSTSTITANQKVKIISATTSAKLDIEQAKTYLKSIAGSTLLAYAGSYGNLTYFIYPKSNAYEIWLPRYDIDGLGLTVEKIFSLAPEATGQSLSSDLSDLQERMAICEHCLESRDTSTYPDIYIYDTDFSTITYNNIVSRINKSLHSFVKWKGSKSGELGYSKSVIMNAASYNGVTIHYAAAWVVVQSGSQYGRPYANRRSFNIASSTAFTNGF